MQWKHLLHCGHIETRKRQAPGKRMGCTACLNRKEDEAAGLDVVVDLEREKLMWEAFLEDKIVGAMEKTKLTGVTITVDADVRLVDGQAQFKKAHIVATGPSR